MCKYAEKPLIFPLSNPSSKAEITADKAYEYSHGRCVYASGEHHCLSPVKVLCMHTFLRGLKMSISRPAGACMPQLIARACLCNQVYSAGASLWLTCLAL